MGAKRNLLRDERGFSMVLVVGVIAVLSILSSSLIYVAMQDTSNVTREDVSSKTLTVAEAGVNAYVWKVNNNHDYYKTTSDPAEFDWVPYQDGEYRISVAQQTGRPGVTITTTARVLNTTTNPQTYVQRRVQAHIEKKSFAQYIYVTDHEEIEGTGQFIYFATGDVLDGPVHSNDFIHINGSPDFKSKVSTARTLDLASAINPLFEQGVTSNTAPMELPTSNQKLKAWAQQDGYYYYGETSITMNPGGTLQIGNKNALSQDPTGTVAVPHNGVIYVDGQTGAKWNSTNGDVYLQGTLSGKLTIAAKDSIYLTGNTAYNNAANDMLGLVAENYILVNHYDKAGNDVIPTNGNVSYVGAIFALNHSFGFEDYGSGTKKGTLTLTGAVAQRYRGPVGYIGSTGFLKAYHYDQRMQYMDPPHFIEPLNAGFEVTDWQELPGN